MANKWDSALKQLIKINPQHFVSWLLEGAQYVGELSPHLNRSLDMDALLGVTLNGKPYALHMEFQRRAPTNMAKRVWEYNVLATCYLDYSVISYVIYLKGDGVVAETPFIQDHPFGSELHRFYFTNVKMWEVPTEMLKDVGLVALLPLLPLTREGATHDIIEETVDDIEHLTMDEMTKRDMISLTLTLASLAFIDKQEDQDWLIRRFRMQHDILWDTPIYQLILEEGREKGMQQGMQQALQEQRSTIQRIVQTKFPKLARLAIGKTEAIADKEKLQDLIVYMSIAQTEADAHQYLLDIDKADAND
jgi:predicted transposase YdaD